MIRKFKALIDNALFFSVVSDRFWSWIIKELFLKLIMRIFIFLFCLSLFGLTPKHVLSQNDKIVIDADKVISVDEIFKIIKSQTDYSFVYHENLFKDSPQVQLKKGTIRLKKLLEQSLLVSDVNIIFTANNTILIKEKTNSIQAQQRKVSGTVTDPAGLPVPGGATVLIKGTTKGTTTDIDGNYNITVPDPANVLVFSSLGFEPQEIAVGNQTTINISLKEDINELDAVTISGRYYNNSQREETGSVGSIDAKIIEKQPVDNPLAAMQGHISGVNISQNSGVPGGDNRIRIRGSGLIDQDGGSTGTRNNPLYIVDGIPYDSGTLEANPIAQFVINNARVSPLNTLNPSDIESIQVLKDADATAIYGTRGANGVVIITTKKGKIGKAKIKLNVTTSLSEVTGFEELLNTEQYLEVRREALTNDGAWPPTNEIAYPDLLLWDQNRYTDWQDVLIGNTAYRQNAQLSYSGGSKQTQFLLSGSYTNQTTIFPGDSKYSKATAHLNISHQSKNENFRVNVTSSYGMDTNNLVAVDFTRLARTLAPNAPALYNDDGSLNWENFTWENPLALLETKYKALTHSIINNVTLSYRPIPTLEFKTNMGFTYNQLKSYNAQPHTRYSPNFGRDSSSSYIWVNDGTRRSWIVEPQINWKYNWGDARLKIFAGASFQQTKSKQLTIRGTGFSDNKLLFNLSSALSSASLQESASDTESDYKFQSFFGRFNFNLKDKYILNLTGRRDGSSRFGPGKQFGYFGAMGVAWLFSEENIFKDNTILSFGKLRASYGITGAEPSGNYQFYDSYQVSGIYNGNGLLEPTRLFNPDYAWAVTKKQEVALELGFFKDRIFFNVAGYRERTSNQLIDTPLPSTTGFSGVNSNLNAIVENKGVEVDLRTVNIKRDHFTWRTTFNISANRNKLVAFPGLEGSTFASRYVVGKPLNVDQLYEFLGVDPETGIYQYKDVNNDGSLDFHDRVWIEDMTPPYFGGLGNTFQYKGLELNVFFQFIKQKGFKYLSKVLSPPGSLLGNVPVTALDRWQVPGDEASIQGYFVSGDEFSRAWSNHLNSSGAITDASFIRLRNVSLSYTVPKTFTKGLGLNIYLQGQNLFVISKYDGADPEVRGPRTLPPLRQFTLGLDLSF